MKNEEFYQKQKKRTRIKGDSRINENSPLNAESNIAEKKDNSNASKKALNTVSYKEKPEKKSGIVFVCSGNTCRSAMAEYILKDYLKKAKITGFKVSSAGLFVSEYDMAEPAKRTLKALNIPFKAHMPRQISEDILIKCDMVICMTAAHKAALEDRYKEKWRNKTVLFAHLTGGTDVFDPYGQNDERYTQTAKYLLYGCKDIIEAAKNLKR